jgi:polyphosphate glucokinase
MDFLGIDIGCTSIKYGKVCIGEEISVCSFDQAFVPQSTRPDEYVDLLLRLAKIDGPYPAVGFGFPSRVWDDEIKNLSIRYNDIWTGVNQVLRAKNIHCYALNDADAAGVAEVYCQQGAALRTGVTIVITLGTGIGSAIFSDGKLMPNSELGMMDLHGMHAEKYAAASIKTNEGLSLSEWAARLQEYLLLVEKIFAPDRIVLGGGISADFEEYRSLLNPARTKLLPAFYRNQAGVIGAAMYAAEKSRQYDFLHGIHQP